MLGVFFWYDVVASISCKIVAGCCLLPMLCLSWFLISHTHTHVSRLKHVVSWRLGWLASSFAKLWVVKVIVTKQVAHSLFIFQCDSIDSPHLSMWLLKLKSAILHASTTQTASANQLHTFSTGREPPLLMLVFKAKCKKCNCVSCGVRTHAHLRAVDLKSTPLTTRANWLLGTSVCAKSAPSCPSRL